MSFDRGSALYELLRQVRPLLLNSARVVEASLRPQGLSVGMRAVLEVLAEHGAQAVPAVADRLDLARQGVQRHVNDLIELGYVETRPNPLHRRSALIVLTRRGREVIDQVRRDELSHLDAMAQDCTRKEVATAVKVLQSLNGDVRRRATQLPALEGQLDDQRCGDLPPDH